MENIEGSEYLILMVAIMHQLIAPGTKVEESFNVQATHDLIYHNVNISAYDHNSFPGVVPRTFAGPLFLSTFGTLARPLFYYFEWPKFGMLFLVRFVLGFTTAISFLNFARAVRKVFGEDVAFFLRVIAASQFHFMFYASRPLPNSFALPLVLTVYQRILNNRHESAVRWATAAAVLFRCELVLLFGPLFVLPILTGRLPLLGWHGALADGVRTMLKVLAVTVPLDSLLWGRLVWPEGEVAWFNIFQNRSHEYGVSPFLWYFYSALPRGLLASLPLSFLGMYIDRRLPKIIIPAIIFVFLYSFLPHKELRFIIYAFPIFNLGAAVFCARMKINSFKGFIRKIVYLGCLLHLVANGIACLFFVYTAAKNYPGSNALMHLQWTQRIDSNKPISVYIDNACAQTGVSRFMELYDSWEYNKTEHLKPGDLERFEFLLLGTYGTGLKETVMTNFTKWHRVMFAIPSFHKVNIQKLPYFPYVFPEVELTEKAAVLRKKYD